MKYILTTLVSCIVLFKLHAQPLSLVSPVDSLVTIDSIIQFEWNRMVGIQKYDLHIAKNPQFNNSSIYSVFSKDTILKVLANRSYFWKVSVNTSSGQIIESEAKYFSTMDITQIPSASLWLSADGRVQTSGGNVTQWISNLKDSTTFFQSTVSQQPQHSYNNKLSKPSINFDGQNDLLTSNFIPLGDSIDVYVVIKPNNSGSIFQSILGTYGITNLPSNTFNYFINFQNKTIVYRSNGITDSKVLLPTNSEYFIGNSYNSNGTAIDMKVNNSSYSTNQGHDLNYAFYPLEIGGPNISNRIFKGEIFEIVLLNQKSDSLRKTINRYLRHKYAPPANLGPDTTYTNICTPLQLDAGARFTSYQWSTGATTQTIHVQQAGTYSVTVTDIFGFQTSDEVVVYGLPEVPSSPAILCANDTLFWDPLEEANGNYTYQWSNNSTDTALAITQPGNYKVTITDVANNCNVVLPTVTVIIDSFPARASLGPDTSFCSGNYITLQKEKAQATSYLWPDGSTGPLFQVNSPGQYWVEAINANGCVARDTINVTVSGYAPTTDFQFSLACEGDTVHFTDLTTPHPGDTLDTWFWDFGDGTTSSQQNPQHLFPDTGTYTVYLNVVNTGGCEQAVTKQVSVGADPIINFTTTNFCTDQGTEFKDFTHVPDGFPINWKWHFGDGDSSGLSNPIHDYATTGDMVVTLRVTSNQGCAAEQKDTITIKQSPEAFFTYDSICVGKLLPFEDQSNRQGGPPLSNWLWNFGDGSTSMQPSPVKGYGKAGIFNVVLTVTSQNGCKDQVARPVQVFEWPEADFQTDTTCIGTPYQFSDSSRSPGTSIDNREWYFGDGVSAIGKAPVHEYMAAGQYLVELKVQSAVGCRDSVVRSITVIDGPEAEFSFDPGYGEAPLEVDFLNNSSGAVSYEWLIDGNPVSQTDNPVHVFNENALYHVRLVATNQFGCMDTVGQFINIAHPVVDITMDQLEVDRQLQTDGNYKLIVTARIVNSGTRVVNSIEMLANVDGKYTISENWEGTLHINQELLYTFQSQFIVPSAGNESAVCVEARTVNGEADDFPLDNMLCRTLTEQVRVMNPYPNPADDRLRLQMILPGTGALTIEEFDAMGRKSRTLYDGHGKKGFNLVEIDTELLRTGTYYLRVTYNEETVIKTFVIMHE